MSGSAVTINRTDNISTGVVSDTAVEANVSENLSGTAGAKDLSETKPDSEVVTKVASLMKLSTVYYPTDSFTQEISLVSVSDLLPSTDQKDQARSRNHEYLCVANRRFAPDIVKSVEQFATSQTVYCEFQICHDITVQVPAVRCFTDIVQIQYSYATIEDVRSLIF